MGSSSMPCGACRCCCCNAGGEARREEPPGASADDFEIGRRRTETPAAEEETANKIAHRAAIVDRAANRISKFIIKGLLILLGVYLYNSMRRYAISYIGKDTWFSTFVVIAIAVPVAEFLCNVGQVATTPP